MTMTDNDDVGKLFVGGLSWETTKENLHNYFSKFGEVVDSVVMKNNETGRSRGFGFVTFKDPSCVAAVLQSKPHELNGRTVDPKECTPRSMQKNKRATPQFKVFLGGLPPDVTETDIRNAMAKFGRVTQVMIMCDQETKKCRGFGFLSFESEDSIDQVCGQRFVNINGKQIECKRAEPRDSYRRNAGQPYNTYQNSQNGSMKPSSFGPGNSAGYQTPGWNAPQQPYMMQGNAYGGYQNYNAPPVAPAYGSNSAPPYNSMPSAQYSQSSYPSYGTGTQYNYAQTPNATSYTQSAARAYSQPPPVGYSNPAASSYSQAAPVPETKAPNVSSTYGAGANAPGASGYGPPKAYTSTFPKAQTYASTDGMGYSGQGVASASKNIGYHPYRR